MYVALRFVLVLIILNHDLYGQSRLHESELSFNESSIVKVYSFGGVETHKTSKFSIHLSIFDIQGTTFVKCLNQLKVKQQYYLN